MENRSIKLEGIVDNIVFFSGSSGYIVLELNLEHGEEPMTVVGELGDVREGERISVEGEFINHPKFGVQFRASYYEVKLPKDTENIVQYLASGVIKDVSYTTAKKIVDLFGEATFDIIETSPERLTQVKGISVKKAERISKEFKDIFSLKKVVSFLAKFTIKSSYAMKAFKVWGTDTLDNVKENPYIMCKGGVDLPFEMADKVASFYQISKTSTIRIHAGFREVLSLATLEGHSCLPERIFLYRVTKLLNIHTSDISDGIYNSAMGSDIDYYLTSDCEKYIYLKEYIDAEKYIAKKVYSMCNYKDYDHMKYSSAVKTLELENNISYGSLQVKAINMALSNNFMVLTGGPGTGKTTTLKAIIQILKLTNLKVKVTAPTGRASKRISEVTGFEATTIHRLLEVTFDELGNQKFVYDENNTLKCDVIIVDETSMVDTLLFEALLKAVRVSCKIILVGDNDQLPSVGAGNVLKDLINSNRIDVVTLNEIFRQAQKSKIITNSHKIINGEYPDIYTKDSDFFFLQRLTPEATLETILQLWKERLPKTYGYNPLDDIQILSPSRKGTLGTINLNKMVQDFVNPHQEGMKEVKNGLYTFRKMDKVMQIKNNYNVAWTKDSISGSGIYNGDIGIVKNITSQCIEVDFDGKIVSYDNDMVDQLELSYAITVHKSQGSEFKAIVMPMLNNFFTLSYRNLLYTAVTRAKDLLIIVGSYRELYQMVDNNKTMLRYTCLKDMLINEFNRKGTYGDDDYDGE